MRKNDALSGVGTGHVVVGDAVAQGDELPWRVRAGGGIHVGRLGVPLHVQRPNSCGDERDGNDGNDDELPEGHFAAVWLSQDARAFTASLAWQLRISASLR